MRSYLPMGRALLTVGALGAALFTGCTKTEAPQATEKQGVAEGAQAAEGERKAEGQTAEGAQKVEAALPEALLHKAIRLTSGETVTLAQFKGKKPVYLKFWATWCKPCMAQMPHFEQVQQRFGGEIEVISINLGVNDDLAAVQKVAEQFKLTMPMAIDQDGELAQAFRLTATPYHLVFDREMRPVHTGHEADEAVDRALEAVAQHKPAAVIDPSVFIESAADVKVDLNDGKLHGVLFTATWCDWYWKDTLTETSKRCVQAQKALNTLAKAQPEVAWLSVVNRLWTGDKELAEYQKKFEVAHALQIDQSNRLFHQQGVREIPALLLIKNGEVLAKVTDFSDTAAITAQITALE